MKRVFLYVLALGGVIALLGLYVQRRDLEGLYLKYLGSRSAVERFESQIAAEKAEEERLSRSVERLERDDPVEIEAAIRENKGLVRPGEKVYRIEMEPK